MTGDVATRPFPTLTVATPRLQIRPVEVADAAPADEILTDHRTRRWLPVSSEAAEIDGAAWCGELAQRQRSSGDGDHYGVVRREDGHLVGCLWTRRTDWVAGSTEIGYALAPVVRGFGMAAEAVDAVAIALLLEHGLQRVEVRVVPGNTASRRVVEKAGLTYEGLLRNAGNLHSGRVDLEVWSLVTADLR